MGDFTPATIAFLFLLCISILFVKKEYVLVPFIIAMCFLPADKSIKIGALNFQALRIMALFGILKVFSSINYEFKLNIIDKLFILYSLSGAIIYIIASQNTIGALLYKGGVCIDSVILYMVLRYSIQSKESLTLVIKIFCICVIVLLPFAVYEKYTGKNLFFIFGRDGVSMRDGQIRAACTFSHSILFGSFAAALIPVFWADFMIKKSIVNITSLLICIFFIYASASSGPIVALAAAICLLFFFRWKENSKFLVWFMLLTATVIHLVREKPIWHFIYMRLSIKASSTGQHRYLLTEAAISEFRNWWLLGYGDVGPKWHLKYWPLTHARFTDVTNQYMLEGVRGGFFPMLVFIILCCKAIKTLGTFSISQRDKQDQWLWWGYTIMMVVHCVSFLSVAYFGQISMLLFLTFAVASFTYDQSVKK